MLSYLANMIFLKTPKCFFICCGVFDGARNWTQGMVHLRYILFWAHLSRNWCEGLPHTHTLKESLSLPRVIRTQGKDGNASFFADLHLYHNLESRGRGWPQITEKQTGQFGGSKTALWTHTQNGLELPKLQLLWVRLRKERGNKAVSWGGREGVSGMWSILSSFLAHFCKLLPLSLSVNNSEFIPGFQRAVSTN